ncbi:MAG TPA: hypothetical protein DCZ95_19125 [Verrucomicrobia bacterium]|nr:MAG: hypothetical protein A2X46_13535 [Lentisphaerae bacterium GWF2_57_35]HBA86199.1 hypothetical protein [Verrucomicrobiota bacterium]
MLNAILVLFALAALGGAVLAGLHLKAKSAPLSLAALHGVLAVAGVILLLVGISQGRFGTAAVAALVLFVMAALGGLALIGMHLRSRPLPAPLIFVHALLAVSGFVTLLVGAVKHVV